MGLPQNKEQLKNKSQVEKVQSILEETEKSLEELREELLQESIENDKKDKISKIKSLLNRLSPIDKQKIDKIIEDLSNGKELTVETLDKAISFLIDSKLRVTELESTKLEEILSQEEVSKETKYELEEEKTGIMGWLKGQKEAFGDSNEKNHLVKNGLRIAGGIATGYLAWKAVKGLWRGAKSLFGFGKEKKEEKTTENKTPRWKKLLIGGAVVGGGVAVYKNRDSISGWVKEFFKSSEEKERTRKAAEQIAKDNVDIEVKDGKFEYNGKTKDIDNIIVLDENKQVDVKATQERLEKWKADVDKNIELEDVKDTSEYLSEHPEEHEKYKLLGDKINNFHSKIGSSTDLLGSSNFEKVDDKFSTGIIPAQLALSYKTVGNLFESDAFNKLEGIANQEGVWEFIKTQGKEALANVLRFVKAAIPDFQFDFGVLDKGRDEIDKAIRKLEESDKKSYDVLMSIFNKQLDVMVWLKHVKYAEEYQLAKEYLISQDPSFADKSEIKQSKKIEDMLDDGEFINTHIKPKLEAGLYKKSFLELADEGIDAKLQPELDDYLDDINEKEADMLDDVDELKESLGSPEVNEDAKELTQNLLDKINQQGADSWYSIFTDSMGRIFNSYELGQEELLEFYNKNVAKEWTDKLGLILKDIEEGKDVTIDQIEDIEQTITDFYATQRSSLLDANLKIEEYNEGLVIRWSTSIYRSGKKVVEGVGLVLTGDLKEGLVDVSMGYLTMDVITAGTSSKILGRALGGFKKVSPTRWVMKTTSKALLGRTKILARPRVASMLSKGYFVGPRLASRLYKGKDGAKALLYHVYNGNLSLKDGLKIADKMGIEVGGNAIKYEWELIQKMGVKAEDAKLLAKYWDNPRVRKQALNLDRSGLDKVRNNYRKLRFEPKLIEKLRNIDKAIGSLDDSMKLEREVFEAMIKNGRELDYLENFISNYTKVLKTGSKIKNKLLHSGIIEPRELGKLLGKYGHKIDDFGEFTKFVMSAEKGGHISDAKLFIKNTINNRSEIKNSGKMSVETINRLGLNNTARKNAAIKMKKQVETMKKNVSKVKNARRMPEYMKKAAQTQWEKLTELSNKITPDNIAVLQRIKEFGELPVGVKAIDKGIVDAIIDKKLGKAIAKAKTEAEIKKILIDNGIDASKVDDYFITKLKDAKSARKVKDWLRYGEKFATEIKTIRRIISHPTMKLAGRALGKIAVGLDFVFVAWTYGDDVELAEQIAKYNMERGEIEKDKANIKLGVGLVGASSALVAVAAMQTVPVVGQIAGAVTLAAIGVVEGVDAYYNVRSAHYKNIEGFKLQDIIHIKQDIVSYEAGNQKTDRGAFDWMNYAFDKEILPKTETETIPAAYQALIYFDEMEKYPYATLKFEEYLNDPDTTDLIRTQKLKAQQNIEKRMEYVKEQLKDGKSIDNLEEKPFQQIDEIIRMSAISLESGEQSPQDMLESMHKDIETNADFKKLDKLYEQNPTELHKINQILDYHVGVHMSPESYDSNTMAQINTNIEFFRKYMNYKILTDYSDSIPVFRFSANPKDHSEIDINTLDYVQIDDFLMTLELRPTGLEESDINKSLDLYTNQEVLDKYNVSRGTGENILYRIAKEALDYRGNNNLEELKGFYAQKDDNGSDSRDITGIYYDVEDGEWMLNDDFRWSQYLRSLIPGYSIASYTERPLARDKEFAEDHEINTDDSINTLFAHINGDEFDTDTGSGKDTIGNSLGGKMKAIILEELSYIKNKEQHKKDIESYIEANSNGKYIQLPIDLIIKGVKSGLDEVGAFVYKRDNGVVAKTNKEHIKSPI